MTEGEVGARDRAPDRREQRSEVVAAPAAERERPLGDRRVDQQVTGRRDRKPHRAVGRARAARSARGGGEPEERGEQCEQSPHQSTSCSSITP
jgi:hypothetical protein